MALILARSAKHNYSPIKSGNISPIASRRQHNIRNLKDVEEENESAFATPDLNSMLGDKDDV